MSPPKTSSLEKKSRSVDATVVARSPVFVTVHETCIVPPSVASDGTVTEVTTRFAKVEVTETVPATVTLSESSDSKRAAVASTATRIE